MSSVAPAHIRAFAVLEKGGDVVDFSYKPMPLQSNQIEIDVIACGVCHSDLHQQHDDWGIANYPIVLGHEIIGHVVALGSDVKHLKLGQRVGVGPQTGSCDHCELCQSGRNQLCKAKMKSYNSPTGDSRQPYTFGGFADKIRVRADWAFPIPIALDAVNAAPIMCAGLTTWAPFIQHDVQRGDVVGIIGIGGLGHMALQFSRALGFETVAISTTSGKRDEAALWGANHFLNINDSKQYESRLGTFDFLLSTVSANNVDWTRYLGLLKPEGKLCMVGLPDTITFKATTLVTRNLSIVGSYLASPAEITRMLKFAAEHHIQAMTETLPMTASNCNLALTNVAENRVRYRMVLVNNKHADSSSGSD